MTTQTHTDRPELFAMLAELEAGTLPPAEALDLLATLAHRAVLFGTREAGAVRDMKHRMTGPITEVLGALSEAMTK